MRYKLLFTLIFITLVGFGVFWFFKFKIENKIISYLKEPYIAYAKAPEIVELKNGDHYILTAGFVKKEIGNFTYKMLAYNDSIPGPILKVSEGAEIIIDFTNNTDIETSIHSHGVRVDNTEDGAVPLNKSVKPGETISYKIKFKDAGMYWYHPHVREDYAQELGLYGNYWVTPENKNYWNPVNKEVPLFLDDILIEDNEIFLSKTEVSHTLMGRYGNVMLVNGEKDYKMQVAKNHVVRFFITNAASARPFKIQIPGVRLKLVGGDSGAYEKEMWADSIVLGPSERAVIEAFFDKEGDFYIENKTPTKTYKLATISVKNEDMIAKTVSDYSKNFQILHSNQEVIKSIDEFRNYFNAPIQKKLRLSVELKDEMDMSGMMHMKPSSDGIEWEDDGQMMNEMSNTDNVIWKVVDEETKKENMDIDWRFKVGEKVKIRIFNDPKSTHPMQHPMHFHGQRFLVLNKNGVKQTNLVWKDTVLVPTGEYVDILLDASNPGIWMAHCHIAEHLEAGMMFHFNVEN